MIDLAATLRYRAGQARLITLRAEEALHIAEVLEQLQHDLDIARGRRHSFT